MPWSAKFLSVAGRYGRVAAMRDGRLSGGRSQLGQAARPERPLFAVLRQLILTTDVNFPARVRPVLTQRGLSGGFRNC